MLLLVTGTIAGTTFTFSNGRITLGGAGETLISVGGIALALELGVIYLAWHMGQIDQRIKSARRRDVIAALRKQLRGLYWWFGAVSLISVIANYLFRVQQLHNVLLAAFVASSPVVLIWVFGVVLRPLPDDYRELAGRANGEALLDMVRDARGVMRRAMRDIAHGKPLDERRVRQVAVASAIFRMHAQADEAHALDHLLSIAAPAQEGVIDAAGDPWLRAEDVATMYGIALRTAQDRMKRTPGRRLVPNTNAYEAPRSQIVARYKEPRARSVRSDALPDAGTAQDRAVTAQSSASYALASAGESHTTHRLVGASDRTPDMSSGLA